MADLIDETMNEIKRNWNITLQEDLNPIPIALELLQQSNPAHDFDSFVRLHGQLETCMEWVVENNYTGFNGAVSTFGGISESIKECKRISSLIKTNLMEFRDQIQYKRTDLPELWAKIEQFKLKISALTTLAEMKRLRGEANELTKKRFFVPAARVLAGILHELGVVGAELDGVDREFARELREDREAFLEKLLEEFCLHAFLKVPGSTTQLVAQALSTFPSLREFPNEFSQEQKRQLVVAPEGDLVMVPTEFNYNPDSNVQAYIYSLFQAAHCLGCLADFCNAIEQRLASELFQIADAEIRRVNRRFHRERIVQKSRTGVSKADVEDSLLVHVPSPLLSHHDLMEIEAFAPFLKAFMDTLLVKFSVIMAVFWKMSEQPFDESSADILKTLFEAAGKSVHEEIRNVLGTFLKGSKMAIQLVPTSHAQNSSSTAAPKATFLFKMTISEEQEDELRPSLGGIGALLTQREKENARKFAKMLVVDQFSSAKEDFGHRPVVKPSLQFLPILFPSFSFFSSCLAELGLEVEPVDVDEACPVNVVEADSRFLERYVADDFLPFLDSFVNQELSMAFNSTTDMNARTVIIILDLDSLLAERVRAEKPDVVRVQGKNSDLIPHCVKSFINLFNLLIKLALRIPTHRASFEGLVKTACTIFADRIGSLLQGISKMRGKEGDGTVAPFFSARQALDASIRDLLRCHPLLRGAEQEAEFIAENEAVLLEKAKGDRSLGVEEVILEDHRRIQDLALLQRGLELLPDIIFTSPEIKWLVSHSKNELKFTDDARLVAGDVEFSAQFAAFMGTFLTQIAQHAITTLLTLRLEIRSHAFYYIDLAMREGNYRLDEPGCEPDVYINTLCRELMGLESILSDWLPYEKYLFCVEGLGPILQTILINGYRQVKECNPNGYLKLQATVKALEQLMALIGPNDDGADLDRVRAYYVLAQAGPKQLLDGAKDCGYRYTQSQYQAILDSHYKLGMNTDADSDDEASATLRREYQNQLVRLQYLNK